MDSVQEPLINSQSLLESFVEDYRSVPRLLLKSSISVQFCHLLNLLSSFAAVVSCLFTQSKQYPFSRQPPTGVSHVHLRTFLPREYKLRVGRLSILIISRSLTKYAHSCMLLENCSSRILTCELRSIER